MALTTDNNNNNNNNEHAADLTAERLSFTSRRRPPIQKLTAAPRDEQLATRHDERFLIDLAK